MEARCEGASPPSSAQEAALCDWPGAYTQPGGDGGGGDAMVVHVTMAMVYPSVPRLVQLSKSTHHPLAPGVADVHDVKTLHREFSSHSLRQSSYFWFLCE